ncbi:MAG: 1-deoxy-D-xylulose-5-phosphate synthase [Candidatus Latescibacteria bacterium]|nr:1-deoxy-D-xylulose-5-phosphate synthase [Candidatus Latescibacterota bacterium]
MKRILDTIESPCDLKRLSISDLEKLADEVRAEICNVVSDTGGHLAPSLGAVELTIALHASLNCPEDKIVWDVGHQSYTHKLITGRRDVFSTLRTENGISGFPNISESEMDAFGTGHASTAISAALGIAAARDIKGTNEKVVAVVGDGAMTGGLSFEGLNNAGASRRDIIVILNDNKMSISSNVGALSKYMTDVISAKPYNRLKKEIWELTGFIPKVGQPVRSVLNRVERSLKALIAPGVWFESLGFRYFGPVDGHNIGHLMQVFSQLKEMKGPLLLHVYTTKGKGYCFAEQDSTRFHGISAFEKETGLLKNSSNRPSYSKVFGDALVELAHKQKNICAITAAMKDSIGLGPFAKEFPERFFDVGIAEGHAVTFAAGLARAGMKPVVGIYSSFLQRSYDNIIHDTALQSLPVVICLDRAGFVGEDGPTHNGVFDISFLRHIPNMIVMAPKDENELRDMLNLAITIDNAPVSIRYPRGAGTASKIHKKFREIQLGKSETLLEGNDIALLAIGETVPSAVKAAKIVADEGISVTVVNMRFVQPLDTDVLDKVYKQGIPVITIEENIMAGGFGSAVMEYYLANEAIPKLKMIGVPSEFSLQASRSRLLQKYGLDSDSIAETIRKVVKS